MGLEFDTTTMSVKTKEVTTNYQKPLPMSEKQPDINTTKTFLSQEKLNEIYKDRFIRDEKLNYITDNQNNLLWQDSEEHYMMDKSETDKLKSWDEAKAYCEQLTIGEYNSWRLPTYQELFNIRAHANNLFRYLNEGVHWTSKTSESDGTMADTVRVLKKRQPFWRNSDPQAKTQKSFFYCVAQKAGTKKEDNFETVTIDKPKK